MWEKGGVLGRFKSRRLNHWSWNICLKTCYLNILYLVHCLIVPVTILRYFICSIQRKGLIYYNGHWIYKHGCINWKLNSNELLPLIKTNPIISIEPAKVMHASSYKGITISLVLNIDNQYIGITIHWLKRPPDMGWSWFFGSILLAINWLFHRSTNVIVMKYGYSSKGKPRLDSVSNSLQNLH